jgi:serine/threonine protein phosphatase PrpC
MAEADVQVALGTLSSAGRVRDENEDAFGCFEPPDGQELKDKGRLFLLADGMGGEAAGEVASRVAVEAARCGYFADPFPGPAVALESGFRLANRAIRERASLNPDLRGMGTTCTGLVLRGREAFVAHVGDSRAYLMRGGAITRLTRDHSLATRGHEFANILTRAVGVDSSIEVDVLSAPLLPRNGDVFILCSDGLWGQVRDEEMLAIASAEPDPQAACRQMVELANERGGPDNITVLVIRIDRAEGGGQRSWLRWLRGDLNEVDLGSIGWITRSLEGP